MENSIGNNAAHELEAKKLQLHWLLQITKAINYNLPSATLFEIYQTVLKEHLKVGELVLVVNEGHWHIPVSYGESSASFPDDVDAAVATIASFTESAGKNDNWVSKFDTVVPVIHQDKPLAYALIDGIDEQVFHSRREIISYIHTITNLIVVAIENKRLAKESIRQAAVQRELELAAQMQSMLFPANLVRHSFLDIAATYIPHQSVGGDYYDFIPLNEDEALVCMADVSGKGISAALLMSNFQANLHALVKHSTTDPVQLVLELNRCVNQSAQGEKFITFFIAKINKHKKQIEYINAGHNPPVILVNDQLTILDQGSTGLGMFEELPFINKGVAEFPEGAMLFCYTDGITEMENRHGHVFGAEMLHELLKNHMNASDMAQLHERMVYSLNEFREEIAFNDDVTFLSIRITD